MQLSTSENALWERTGLVLGRSTTGNGSHVVGDPSVVWDPEIGGWRMILFFDPPGHGTSISMDPTAAPGTWSPPEPMVFANPQALPPNHGGTHKPFVVMDARRPNVAAFVDGRYWLVTVSFTGNAREKRVQRASAISLAGPWTLEEGTLIPRGEAGAFDENHADAVSGFWFEDEGQFLYFYMGYPLERQPWLNSPYGNAIGVVSQRPGEDAIKRGIALSPSDDPAHWTAGYLGGLQLMPGIDHKWVAVINGSPTAPDRLGNLTSEEPAPSLGGLAFSDADFPLNGWVASDSPFEWIVDLPVTALADGEGVNFWRHHVVDAGGTVRMFYNSGTYGAEQMYSKELVGERNGERRSLG